MTRNGFVPDWAPHSFCWMAWGLHPEWGAALREMADELQQIITAISDFEPVRLLTPRHLARQARAKFLGANVKIIETPVDDIWMRDIAPLYIVRGSEVIPLDLNFNGWGAPKLRPQRPGDRLAGTARNLFGGEMINAGFVAEGDAFVVGRDGVVFTTRSCLLNRNRNPQLNETDIEFELLRLGATKVIWLDGDAGEQITSGHVDGYVLPTESGELLVQACEDDDPCAEVRDADLARLGALSEMGGSPFRLKIVKAPRITPSEDSLFAATYLNAYTPNGAVIASKFGDRERDREAQIALAEAFPGREVRMLSTPNIARGGGGIRCLVQPVPAAR
ncbi:agmatine deiminase family protein [Bradyrhizobium sp. 482_C4_N1_1]|uniref:agmatine deiminase family protein n=1 Tax=unclassified Bradyrhizobium TaxID=2631580 RepID=UPI003F88827F